MALIDKLTAIGDAIRYKNGSSEPLTLEQMVTSINNLQADVDVPSTTYVIGNPIEFVLSVDSWNGTSYSLEAENYSVGSKDVQIGLPSKSSTVNAQAVIKAALTIVKTYNISADKENGTPAYAELIISAVNTPTKDITVAIFGLEAVV